MAGNSYDVEMINMLLNRRHLHLKVKPIADGTRFFSLCAIDDSHMLKVPVSFIGKLEQVLRDAHNIGFTFNISRVAELFFDEILKKKPPSFEFFPYLGFLTRDYAEFFIDLPSIVKEHLEGNMLLRGGLKDNSTNNYLTKIRFSLGEMKVEVSHASSLFCLLNMKVQEYYLQTIETAFTIKVKGTSAKTLDDDLYSALYYLSVLLPTKHGDIPRITQMITEEDLSQLQGTNYTVVNIDTTTIPSFPKPSYPIALRFFYHANLLIRQGAVQEALLYYYKVLEHFFDIAWHHRIGELVSQAAGDNKQLAKLLKKEQPREDDAYLQLVLELVLTDTLWQTISEYKFCDTLSIKALAQKIYRSRNEVAHGKLDDKFELSVPSVLSELDLSKKLAIFEMIAKETLLKLGGIVL